MTRPYDNGRLSEKMQQDYLANIARKLTASRDASTSHAQLPALMADFFGKVARHRDQTETERALNVSMFADENGRPVTKGYFETLGRSLVLEGKSLLNELRAWGEKQDMAAAVVGAHIDDKLKSAGIDLSGISKKQEVHARLGKVVENLEMLDDNLSTMSNTMAASGGTAVGSSLRMAASGSAELYRSSAKECSRELEELLAEFPDLLKSMEGIQVPSSILLGQIAAMFPGSGETQDTIDDSRAAIRELATKINKWDVMESYHAIWVDRAALCSLAGLAGEAKGCNEVAQQYDPSYFEPLEQSWRDARAAQLATADKPWGSKP